MDKLISVVIPIFNEEEYLERCINSILVQTYKNLEIILVNDGSTDKSGQICDNYAQKDPRIKVIHKKNGGLSSARNKGIDISNGEFLSFLDSDDWVTNKYIETLYSLIKEHNAEISVVNFEKIYETNQNFSSNETVIKTFNKYQALRALTDDYYHILVTSTAKLYERSLFNKIRFPLNKIHEDEFVAHHLYYMANNVVVSTEKHMYYWQHANSIMGSGYNTSHRLHALEAIYDRKMCLEKLNMSKPIANVNKLLFSILRDIYTNDPSTSLIDVKQELEFMKKELDNNKYDFTFTLKYKIYYFALALKLI